MNAPALDPTSTNTSYVTQLTALVERAAPALRELAPEAAAQRPAGDAWSPKEIVGHLIDSAANNHARFLRAQHSGDLLFDGYDQEAWVTAQCYQDAPWPELVELWYHYNLHLARVMAAVPPAIRLRVCTRHNLNEIAWRRITPDEPATLDYLMHDYVLHLEHHLRQIAQLTSLPVC